MNLHITELVNKKDMPVSRTFSLNLDDPDTPGQIRIKLVIPKDVNERDGEKLAVVVMMPEEPGDQQVDNSWKCGLECFLASRSHVGVVRVDVRGSSGQGTKWQQSVRGRLGMRETQDLDQVIRFLAGLQYIDKDKIGVYGQAYGGFLVLNALLSNQPVLRNIRCGMSVSPITDWMYSTAFVAERLLGLPDMKDNWLEYERTTLVGRKDLTCLKSKHVMMVHGVADKKVLVENTMMMSKRMVDQNILFDQQVNICNI